VPTVAAGGVKGGPAVTAGVQTKSAGDHDKANAHTDPASAKVRLESAPREGRSETGGVASTPGTPAKIQAAAKEGWSDLGDVSAGVVRRGIGTLLYWGPCVVLAGIGVWWWRRRAAAGAQEPPPDGR